MSIQAGIWSFDGTPVDRQLLAAISSQTVDYGPDDEGIYIAGNIGLLYRPFHTTPESRFEHQPHTFADGKVVTWDGRLDNRDELLRALGQSLNAHSPDLDIVTAAYEKWDCHCFSRLIGDWALAIWDPKENSTILARDYVGIRRLYYRFFGTTVAWCSSLESLALLRRGLSLDEDYVATYLAMKPDPRLTPYREIQCVPPGGWIRIHDGHAPSYSYWSFNPQRQTRYQSDSEYEEQFRFLLRQAVRRRLRSCSPVLAELSGGYDSSAIVCMADEVLNHLSTQSSRVDTFSYCFPDEPESDDHLYFVKVQEKRGRGGHSAMILGTGDSFSPEYSKFVATPGFGARREVTCARDAVARDSGYRVILSGIGGDEFMGQALDPRVQMADLLSHLRLHALNKELLAWSILTRRPWIQLAAETLLLLLPSSVRARFTAGARPDAWLDPAFAKRYNFSYLLLQASAGPFSWRPSARDSLQTYLTLSGLLTNSSPENQEIRYPYLDRDLFEFLTSIPPGQILRPGDRRSLMRRALVGVVPAEILARKTKQSETRCHIVTLAKHWDRIEEHISAPLSATCGFINKSEFRAALIAAKNGKMSRHFLFLLRALSFELWFQYVTKNNIITLPQHCASNIPASSDNALAVLS